MILLFPDNLSLGHVIAHAIILFQLLIIQKAAYGFY